MNKPKTIFTIGIQKGTPSQNASDLGRNLERLIGNDYYVLIYMYSGEDPKIEVFNADITEMQFEELKEKVSELCA